MEMGGILPADRTQNWERESTIRRPGELMERVGAVSAKPAGGRLVGILRETYIYKS